MAYPLARSEPQALLLNSRGRPLTPRPAGPMVIRSADLPRSPLAQRGALLLRRSQLGDYGIAPLVAIAAAKQAGGVVSGLKKVLGMGSDPTTDAHRIDTTLRALAMAKAGSLPAFLFLRARTNGFNHPKFQIPVPPIAGITPGGRLTGWGSKAAEKVADDAYRSVRALFPQVPEQGNQILSTPSDGTAGGVVPPGPQVPAQRPGEIVVGADGNVTYPPTGGGGGASTDTGAAGGPAPAQAGIAGSKVAAALLGSAVLYAVIAGRGPSPARRRRRRG